MTENQLTCPKCNSPVKPGMKFCESCGARIETTPSCPKCGTEILPNAKFCESCGASIGAAAAPAPGTPAPEAKVESKGAEKKDIPAPAPVAQESSKAQKPAEPAIKTGTKPASSRTTLIVAGIVILVILGAAVYFIGLPLLSGSGGTPGTAPAPEVPGSGPAGASAAGSSASDQSPASSSAAPVSFTTGPTQEPPAPMLVKFSAARDPITGLVTVTFDGGAGRYGVKNVDIRLSRSDGQVIDRTVTLTEIGDGLTLQGTKTGDDHIELTANFNNGEHYKIIDQILEYKRRSW